MSFQHRFEDKKGLIRLIAKDGFEFWLPDLGTPLYEIPELVPPEMAFVYSEDDLPAPVLMRCRIFHRRRCGLQMPIAHGRDLAIWTWHEYLEGERPWKDSYDIEARHRAERGDYVRLPKPRAPGAKR